VEHIFSGLDLDQGLPQGGFLPQWGGYQAFRTVEKLILNPNGGDPKILWGGPHIFLPKPLWALRTLKQKGVVPPRDFFL